MYITTLPGEMQIAPSLHNIFLSVTCMAMLYVEPICTCYTNRFSLHVHDIAVGSIVQKWIPRTTFAGPPKVVRGYGVLSASVFPVLRQGQIAAANWLGPLLHSRSKGSHTYKIEWWAGLGGAGLAAAEPFRPATSSRNIYRAGHFARPLCPGTFCRASLSRATLSRATLSRDILPLCPGTFCLATVFLIV